MRLIFSLILLSSYLTGFSQNESISGYCLGRKYTIELPMSNMDTVITSIDGYYRSFQLDSKKGFISINCLVNTVSGSFRGEDYLTISDSLNVRQGVVNTGNPRYDTSYVWKDKIIHSELWISYLCERKDLQLFEDAFKSFNIQPKPNQIKGIVTDGKGNPLNGCNVVIKGTVTDECGRFSLRTFNKDFTLVFHHISYRDMGTFEFDYHYDKFQTSLFQLGDGKIKNTKCRKIGSYQVKYELP